jgi:two-component system, cell cycle sensor histidine kinase and response regulator CckA
MSDAEDQKRAVLSENIFPSAELHRLLFEEAIDGMFVADFSRRYVSVNQQFSEMTGYSRQELLEMTSMNLVSAEDLARIPISEEKLCQDRYAAAKQSLIRKDGSPIPVVIHARALSNGNILGTVRNIAEPQQVETSLASEKSFSDAIIDSIPGIFYVFDERGFFVRGNRNQQVVLGYTKEELLKMNALETIAKEDRDLVAAGMREAFEKGSATIIARVLTKDKKTFPYLLTGLVTRIAGKQYLVGVATDITELKKVEDVLIRERSFFDDIINSLPGIFYMYDDKGMLVRWNRKHEEVTGYSSEELLGMYVLDFFAEEHKEYLLSRVQAVFAEREAFGEAPVLTKNGNQVPYFFTGRLAVMNGQQYLIGVGLDMSERKRAEEEKNHLQVQLLQAQKMELVGQLAGGVAHDFNNMLGVIVGYADLALRKTDPAGPVYRNIERILSAADRSANLVRQLLAFARKQTIDPRVLNLNETVESILRMLGRLIGEDIELIWQPGPNLSLIKMDPTQIDQILANLCVNSRDAISGVGKVIIETMNVTLDKDYCSRHAGFKPGDFVMLAVSDDGSGIDKETKARLFEPFFTTKSTGKGTGLGLATVYGIVKQNDGFINVYSEPGQGTIFRVYLPCYTGEVVEVKPGGTSIVTQGRNETILLVEDEPIILEIGMAMLKELGYQVLAVGRSSEAVRLAETYEGEIHLLMTDVVMPEMNGRELAEHVVAVRHGIKCLFMSGYTSNVITHRGVLDEGVNFIQKPFSMQALAEKVREVLDQGKTG